MENYEDVRDFYKEAYKKKFGITLSDQEADKLMIELHERKKEEKEFQQLLENELKAGVEHLLKERIDYALETRNSELFYQLARGTEDNQN